MTSYYLSSPLPLNITLGIPAKAKHYVTWRISAWYHVAWYHTITIKLHHVKWWDTILILMITRCISTNVTFSSSVDIRCRRIEPFSMSTLVSTIMHPTLQIGLFLSSLYLSNWITKNGETCDSLTQRSVVGANVIAGGELRCKGGFPYPRCTQHADFVSGHSFVARVLLCLYPWKLWRRAEKQKSFQTCGWLVSIWQKRGSSPDIFLLSYRHSYFYSVLLLFSFPCKIASEMGRGILILLAISSIGILKIGWVMKSKYGFKTRNIRGTKIVPFSRILLHYTTNIK